MDAGAPPSILPNCNAQSVPDLASHHSDHNTETCWPRVVGGPLESYAMTSPPPGHIKIEERDIKVEDCSSAFYPTASRPAGDSDESTVKVESPFPVSSEMIPSIEGIGALPKAIHEDCKPVLL